MEHELNELKKKGSKGIDNSSDIIDELVKENANLRKKLYDIGVK